MIHVRHLILLVLVVGVSSERSLASVDECESRLTELTRSFVGATEKLLAQGVLARGDVKAMSASLRPVNPFSTHAPNTGNAHAKQFYATMSARADVQQRWLSIAEGLNDLLARTRGRDILREDARAATFDILRPQEIPVGPMNPLCVWGWFRTRDHKLLYVEINKEDSKFEVREFPSGRLKWEGSLSEERGFVRLEENADGEVQMVSFFANEKSTGSWLGWLGTAKIQKYTRRVLNLESGVAREDDFLFPDNGESYELIRAGRGPDLLVFGWGKVAVLDRKKPTFLPMESRYYSYNQINNRSLLLLERGFHPDTLVRVFKYDGSAFTLEQNLPVPSHIHLTGQSAVEVPDGRLAAAVLGLSRGSQNQIVYSLSYYPPFAKGQAAPIRIPLNGEPGMCEITYTKTGGLVIILKIKNAEGEHVLVFQPERSLTPVYSHTYPGPTTVVFRWLDTEGGFYLATIGGENKIELFEPLIGNASRGTIPFAGDLKDFGLYRSGPDGVQLWVHTHLEVKAYSLFSPSR